MSKQPIPTATPVAQMRYARICPNANNWTSPSGGEKYGGPTTFSWKNGFGFDEWLLGTPVIKSGKFKGYKLGFIQAFKDQKPGISHEVGCYWLDDNKQAHLAIQIKQCQKIDDSELLKVCREYIKDEFTEKMDGHLRSLGLCAPIRCDPLEVFNVVFKTDDVQLIVPPSNSPVSHHRYSKLYY